MSREIKFKFWDVNRKEMRLKNGADLFMLLSSLVAYKESSKNLIFLQYTGLKDKNGKEIYEGDILKNRNKEKLLEIKWNETYGGYSIFFLEFTLNKLKVASSVKFKDLLLVEEMEVIGNIYENPELLK